MTSVGSDDSRSAVLPSGSRLPCMRGVLAAIAAAVAMMVCVAPASADALPPGCERVPIFGLNPQVREICDLPIQPDGSWERWRWFWSPATKRDTCSGVPKGYYGDGGSYGCPPGLTQDWTPESDSPVDKYIVTPDTIPPGEPGYIGG